MNQLILDTWKAFQECGLVRADLDQHMLCVAFLRGINSYEQGAFAHPNATEFDKVLSYINAEIYPMLRRNDSLMNRFRLNQYYALIYGRRLSVTMYQQKHIQIDFHHEPDAVTDYEKWCYSFNPLTPTTIRMKEERDRKDQAAADKIAADKERLRMQQEAM